MHDFTWKGFFKLYAILVSPLLLFAVYDMATTPDLDVYKGIETLALFVGGPFPGYALLYGAFAPFAAACSEAYRYERQRGGSRLYAAACGVASMFGLLLVLIPVALFMAVVYAFIWALQQVNGLQLVLGMLAVLGTIAFFWDAIKTRLHLNKLNVFKLSDSRKIIRK